MAYEKMSRLRKFNGGGCEAEQMFAALAALLGFNGDEFKRKGFVFHPGLEISKTK